MKMTPHRMMKIALFAPILAGMLVLNASGADAFVCRVSASPIVFGGYDTLSPNGAVAVGTLTYSCVGKGRRIEIGLTRGHSSSFGRRELRNGGRRLAYNLYLDPSGTEVWGNGTGGSHMYIAPAPPSGTSVSVTIYGRIDSRQRTTSAGHYHDNVGVILDY